MVNHRNTPSGQYFKAHHQNGEYEYFVPKPLPPTIKLDEELLYLAMDAQRYLSEFGTKSKDTPGYEYVISAFINKEAEFSCQIEGTQASVIDALKEKAGIEEKDRPKDGNDIINYINALRAGIKLLENTDINLFFIRHLHQQLLAHQPEKEPGAFRTKPNQIGGIPYNPASADFVPPAPFEMEQCLTDLEKFSLNNTAIAPLLKAGLMHAQFETIHPFRDGNGRVGRILIPLQLYKAGVIGRPILFMSLYFKKHKDDYYTFLQAVHDDGAWEEWLKFFLKGAAESAMHGIEMAQKIEKLMNHSMKKIQEFYGKRKIESAIKCLWGLFYMPYVSAADIKEISGKSIPTAYSIIRDFQKIGILKKESGKGKDQRYAFSGYIQLLDSIKS